MIPRTMDLRQLRYFVTLAEEAHFGRAAERLHIVQPALSMQIRALEEELGGPLFVRTSRRVELTEAGVVLQNEALRTLEQAEHARRAVQRSLRGELGQVRIGFAGNAVFSGRLSNDLRRFREAYPDAEVQVREMVLQAQVEALEAGLLDVGYAPLAAPIPGKALSVERAGEWPLMVAMHTTHRLAGRRSLRGKDIAAHPLILYAADDADARLLSSLADVLGREPIVAHHATSTLTVMALASAGLGLALVPATVLGLNLPGLAFVPLAEPSLRVRLALVSRTDETAGAVKAFLGIARREAGEGPLKTPS